MLRKKSKNNITSDPRRFPDIFIGAMLAVVVGFMPIFVRAIARPYPAELARFPGEEYIDFFAYGKFWALFIPAVLIVFYYISDVATGGILKESFQPKKIFKNPVVIASLVFLFFMFVSALLSDYPQTVIHGTKDRFEGIMTWMAYFAVFFAAMYYVRGEKFVKPILWGLIFSSIIMGFVGLGQFIDRDVEGLTGLNQFIGTNIFSTDFGARLFAGDGIYWMGQFVEREHFRVVFTIAHGTLYNPNTFGLYSAMLTPILLICGFTYRGKKWINGLLLLAGTLMLFSVFGSGSLGGMVGIVSAAGVLVLVSIPVLYRFSSVKLWLIISATLVLIVVAFLFIPFLNARATYLITRFRNTVSMANVRPQDYVFENNQMTIIRHGETIAVVTVDMDVHTEFDWESVEGGGLLMQPGGVAVFEPGAWITVQDASGLELAPVHREAGITENEEFFVHYIYEVSGYGHLALTRFPGHFVYRGVFMMNVNDTLINICPVFRTLHDLSQPVPSIGFHGREAWGSGRGFIFSRTFPMMPQYWLIGSGPDTYVNVFPHHDRFGALDSGLGVQAMVDKAHNLYLQTWITKGGVAALALIFLFAYYMVTTFITLVRQKKGDAFTYGLRLGLLAGVTAFVVTSLATDSTIGSTGVFFILLGMGYGVNAWVEKAGEAE